MRDNWNIFTARVALGLREPDIRIACLDTLAFKMDTREGRDNIRTVGPTGKLLSTASLDTMRP